MSITLYAPGLTVEVLDNAVIVPPANPTITGFVATPGTITAGQSTVLSATVTNAVSMTLDGSPVTLPVTVTPASNHSYTLVATGAPGSVAATASVSVVVNAVVVPPSTGKVPVIGTSHMHEQEGWMADWIDPVVAKGRALPWTLGADLPNGVLAYPKKGAAVSRVQSWHVWGNPSGLYSEIPWFDPQGRSHPYNSANGDDYAVMVADLKARPPNSGPRGLAMPVSYTTVIPHPTMFPPADASMPKTPNTGAIPRHPLVIWVRHDALMQLGYADGRVRDLGFLPGISTVHDACIDGRFMTDSASRKILYVCDIGTKSTNGVWSGGRIARVDRMPGAEAIGGTPAENPSAYTVTTFATAAFPTAVRSDPTGAVYWIEDDATGVIKKCPLGGSPVTLATVPNAFAMDYANGKLYLMCSTGHVYIMDATTGVMGANLMPSWALYTTPPIRGTDFFTISVDANGTCGPVGQFSCSRVHTGGNMNIWHFAPDGTNINTITPTGQGFQSIGDAYSVHELYGHYIWQSGKYHIDQAVRFVGGYANTPVGVLVHDAPYPASAYVSDYTVMFRGMRVICKGGAVQDFNRPSLTCLMSREGWSMFAGCSNDEIAEMDFDAAEKWIQGGYAGSFPRPDIVGVDLYCVFLLHLLNSQRHIREGAALLTKFQAWWTGKGRTIPAVPADTMGSFAADPPTTHKDGNGIPFRLEVRETAPGAYRIGIFGTGSNDTKYTSELEVTGSQGPIPSDAVIVVDKGMPGEVTLPATLTPGWHAFSVKAAGWATNALTYLVP